MRRGLRFALLLLSAALAGCTVSPNSTSGTTGITPAGNWTNWQIQAGTAITSPPNTYPSFTGALDVQGTTASGVFTILTSAAAAQSGVGFTGSVNSSDASIFQNSVGGYQLLFPLPITQSAIVPADVFEWCGICANGVLIPSVEVEIPPLTGTYTGTLTDPTKASMIGVGTGVLTLTQSSTPNSNGQFPLTGTFAYTSDINLGSNPVGGTVSGEGITLSNMSASPGGPTISLTASTDPSGTQITVSNLTWAETGVTYTFTGTLTLQ